MDYYKDCNICETIIIRMNEKFNHSIIIYLHLHIITQAEHL